MIEHSDYTPDSVRFWIQNWRMLISATEGGTGASGKGSGRGGRFGLVCLKADLERAADQLPLYWQSTEYVFARQRRSNCLQERRRTTPAVPEAQRQFEPPVPSDALEQACYRMALSLGWRPEQENVA
jgi:hypothetical protein